MTQVTPKPGLFLDDGTGTYPIDITSRLSLSAAVSVANHGRSDEFGTATSATFTCTLKNNDGALSSTGAIAIAPGTGIRYIETYPAVAGTAVNRFTGKVSSLELGWDGGVAKASQVLVNAVDLLAELTRRTLRSMLEQDILVDSPTAYYTLGEPAGSTSAGDTSGNQNPPLASTGAGAAVVFGNGTGPVDGLTAAQFVGGGQQLQTSLPASFSPAVWSMEVFIAMPVAPVLPGASIALIGSGAAQLFVNNLGQIQYLGTSGSITGPVITDGATHEVVVTHDAHNAWLYVDGVLILAPVADTLVGTPVGFLVGGFNGTLSHVALYGTTLSAARVASHSGAAFAITETTDARMTRLASYVGTTCITSSGSGQMVTRQDTRDQKALDAMQTVVASEGGVLFVDGSGQLRMQGRYYRTLDVTPMTVASKDVGSDSVFPRDTLLLVNSCTVTRDGGATQLVQDASATSPTGPGLFPESLDLIVADDAAALAAAQWLVAKHLTPIPRIGAVTIKLLTSSSVLAFLQTEIGDRWTLSGMPTQNWAGIGDYTVEGWSETLTVSGGTNVWELSVNLVPWVLNQAWILGDSTYGVLGSTTILGY